MRAVGRSKGKTTRGQDQRRKADIAADRQRSPSGGVTGLESGDDVGYSTRHEGLHNRLSSLEGELAEASMENAAPRAYFPFRNDVVQISEYFFSKTQRSHI